MHDLLAYVSQSHQWRYSEDDRSTSKLQATYALEDETRDHIYAQTQTNIGGNGGREGY